MTMYERIKVLRENQGISQQKLAEMVGYKTASAVNKIELGLRDLNQTKIIMFAKALGVSPQFLLSGESSGTSSRAVRIPVFAAVPAGIPIEAVEDIVDFEEISPDMASQGDFFALRVKGDSMEPRIKENDVVIVRRQESVDNGDLAVVLINSHDATLKRFYMNETGVKLVSSNPKYDPFFFTPAEVNALPVSVIGKVVELRAKF